jgi:hypothetical protein
MKYLLALAALLLSLNVNAASTLIYDIYEQKWSSYLFDDIQSENILVPRVSPKNISSGLNCDVSSCNLFMSIKSPDPHDLYPAQNWIDSHGGGIFAHLSGISKFDAQATIFVTKTLNSISSSYSFHKELKTGETFSLFEQSTYEPLSSISVTIKTNISAVPLPASWLLISPLFGFLAYRRRNSGDTRSRPISRI